MKYKKLTVVILSILSIAVSSGQRRSEGVSLRSPLDIPLVLSGNFGELRRNHFHSGLDFKTQGRTGLPVYAADDGYVSRVSVSPWGFGRAVYITHPSTGLTTVYGHLEAFVPAIDKIVRDRQYAEETFSIDMAFSPDEIPVKRGDVIARSGNSGSSGGPHLHFDVRDTETEDPLDPMEYYRTRIKDNVAPEVRQLAIYPVNGGTVNGEDVPVYRQPDGTLTFTAWGNIVPGIKAYDRMTGTNNIYGVKYLTLTLDGDTVYRRVVDRFSFDNTRALHTLINNADLIDKSSWIMTTRIPDANPLAAMVKARNNGIIDINEERPYHFTWLLEDEHGNKTSKKFTVNGKRKLVDAPIAEGQLMLWDAFNVYDDEEAYLEIPSGALYDNEFITVTSAPMPGYLSKAFTVGDKAVPLAKAYNLSIPLLTDTLPDKNQYCLVSINGTKRSAVPAAYSDGLINAQLTDFGKFAVTIDDKPPVITPLNKERWRTSGVIKFKLTDNLSGVDKWRGEIDGKFALFEFDGKTATLSFKIDSQRFPGKSHDITLTVTDACGNQAIYTSKL